MLLLLLFLLFASAVAAVNHDQGMDIVLGNSPSWGPFSRGACISPAHRNHQSRLQNAGGNPRSDCERTRATINNIIFARPNVCVERGREMWGEFYVPDLSCAPAWGTFVTAGCIGATVPGRARYTSTYSLNGVTAQANALAWCRQTPARVRGNYFERPTICVQSSPSTVTGEFHLLNACCSRRIHKNKADNSSNAEVLSMIKGDDEVVEVEVNDGYSYMLQQTGPGCDSNQDAPPFPLERVISTTREAVLAFNELPRWSPWSLSRYLWSNQFSLVGSWREGGVVPGFATTFNQGSRIDLRFLNTRPSPGPGDTVSNAFNVLTVPTTSSARLLELGGRFPTGTFVTVDVRRPSAPVLLTERLTGCTLAFGWDNANGIFYMGHAEPSDDPLTKDRVSLANYMRKNGRFEGASDQVTMSYIGGNDDVYGYYGGQAQVIGFFADDSVYIIVQVKDPHNDISKGWSINFFKE